MQGFLDPTFDVDDLPCMPELLELRLKVRGNPEGLAIVDRCIALACRAATANAEEAAAIQSETQAISAELAVRYGAPRGATLQ